MLEILQIIATILVFAFLPWCVWVTQMIFGLKQEQAINKHGYTDLKEDLNQLKEKLDKLIEIQTYAHWSNRKGVPFSGSDNTEEHN